MAGADESTGEIWTVVVGCTSADIRMHNLRLHRLRVDATSGRVLGRPGDLLRRLMRVAPADDEAEVFPDARAALITRDDDQRRLYLFCDRWLLSPGSGWGDSGQVATPISKPTVAMALDLSDRTLPTIFAMDLPSSSCALAWPVPAAAKIWAPYVAPIPGGRGRSRRLTMLHLDETSDDQYCWIDAGSIDLPQEDSSSSSTISMSASGTGYYSSIYGGYAMSGKTPLLQGFAVLGDVILVSLRTCDFYLFRCSTCHWSRVYLVDDCCHYIPLNGRAVFSEEDDHIYFFRDSCLYAYKFSLEEGKMAPPIKLASLYDDFSAHGNAFIAGLSNRVLCVAWIGMDLACGCTTRHLLATRGGCRAGLARLGSAQSGSLG